METLKLLLTIFTLVILILLTYEDFRHKEISVINLSLLFITTLIYTFLYDNWHLANILLNLGILSLMFLFIKIYSLFKNDKEKGVINNGIGLGDLIIAIGFTFVFCPINFLLFLDLGFILGVLYYYIFKPDSNKIPLAGIFAFVYALIVVITSFIYKDYTIIFQKESLIATYVQ